MRLRITQASGELTQTIGRSPTVADLAAHLHVTEEEILEGLEGAQAYSATSLSTPVGPEGALELGDTLGEEDEDMRRAARRLALGPAMAALGERDRRILALRFYGNLTQSEIAEQLGISQMHVSRLIARALRTLRGFME